MLSWSKGCGFHRRLLSCARPTCCQSRPMGRSTMQRSGHPMNIADYFAVPQFRVGSREKQRRLLEGLNWLTQYHYQRSEAYKRLLDRARRDAPHHAETLDEVPYIPVSLFKTHRLQSVPDTAIRNV